MCNKWREPFETETARCHINKVTINDDVKAKCGSPDYKNDGTQRSPRLKYVELKNSVNEDDKNTQQAYACWANEDNNVNSCCSINKNGVDNDWNGEDADNDENKNDVNDYRVNNRTNTALAITKTVTTTLMT